jgi:hypothetical protein
MRNPCLEAVLRELEAVGIRDVEQIHGGKHWQVRWRVNGHGLRVYSVPCSPSDWRSPYNARAQVRRLLREDGILTAPERPASIATPPSPAPKPDRIAELERRVQALEDLVCTIQSATGGNHG